LDQQKFTTIAHGDHRYYSPLSVAKAAALVALFRLQPSDRVLDIGCGRAQLLIEILQAHPCQGVGVDRNEAFVALAQASAEASGVSRRLTIIARPPREAITDKNNFAAIVCMGSSQAIGSFAEALAWSYGMLRPGGVALFADGYWKRPPADDYLRVLGATADEMQTHAGNAELARSAGYRVLHTMTSSDDEWDEYEGRYCGAIERYIDANPDDPDVDAMAKRIRPWHDAYLQWGRDTLGFGFYFLLKPSRK
jgi:SAM-dependent methyltransferase